MVGLRSSETELIFGNFFRWENKTWGKYAIFTKYEIFNSTGTRSSGIAAEGVSAKSLNAHRTKNLGIRRTESNSPK